MSRAVWAALIAGVSLSLGAGVAIAAKHDDFVLFQERLNSLGDNTIGDSREQLLYEHGDPDRVGDNKSPTIPVGNAEREQLGSYRVWRWTEPDGSYQQVIFDDADDRAATLECEDVSADEAFYCYTVGTASTLMSPNRYLFSNEDSITVDLGRPNSVTFYEENGGRRKILGYEPMGLWLTFENGRLMHISRSKPSPSFWWWLRNGPSL